jgi:hypothetical protein
MQIRPADMAGLIKVIPPLLNEEIPPTIIATQLIQQIRKELCSELRVAGVFEAPTLESFSARIDASMSSSAAPRIDSGPWLRRRTSRNPPVLAWVALRQVGEVLAPVGVVEGSDATGKR